MIASKGLGLAGLCEREEHIRTFLVLTGKRAGVTFCSAMSNSGRAGPNVRG